VALFERANTAELLMEPPTPSLSVPLLITVVTAEPILLVGAGAPGAKPAAGFDLGLVILEVAGSGAGHGELVPATKIRLDQKDAIVTEDYHDVIVRLTNVAARPGGTR